MKLQVPEPGYLRLGRDTLRRRAHRALAGLVECRTCPWGCGVDRLSGEWSFCRTGRYAVVGSYSPHHGEEDCLTGRRGSGTIFFAHCNLRCVFCQNFDISQSVPAGTTPGHRPGEIARMMLELQAAGCHNINLVTPEHLVPQMLEAVAEAAENGLRLPLVYNTSAYDAIDSLKLLDGVVDIYMPDFKLWSPDRCGKYLGAENYGAVARAAILEMHRQVGDLETGHDGVAQKGVLVRHLIMPDGGQETRAILEWLAETLGTNTYLNLLTQYRPAAQVGGGRYPELDRPPSKDETREARGIARELGLTRLDGREPPYFRLHRR